jgi:hypothetical protein
MIGSGNRSTRRKPAPVPLCSPQTPHAARLRIRAAAVGSQRLTTWVTVRPTMGIQLGLLYVVRGPFYFFSTCRGLGTLKEESQWDTASVHWASKWKLCLISFKKCVSIISSRSFRFNKRSGTRLYVCESPTILIISLIHFIEVLSNALAEWLILLLRISEFDSRPGDRLGSDFLWGSSPFTQNTGVVQILCFWTSSIQFQLKYDDGYSTET